MFFCTRWTSDLVIDCARGDHETLLSFRKLQGLLVLFSPGMRRSKVQLHKSEKIFISDIAALLSPLMIMKATCSPLREGAFQEFIKHEPV